MTGPRYRHLWLACAVSLAATAAAATELPVVSVTLSNAGLAQIERRGTVAADAPVVLRAPTADIDDLLKSLVVLDPVGTVEGVRLPARDTAAEAFRGLPLRPEDFASRVALLRALRGQQVEAGGVTGRLADAEETEAGLRVAILTEAGVAAAIIREGDEVRLTDAALAARVRRAADALGAARAEDERRIEVGLRADRAREVGVLSVTGAPLWKPSWRLLVPEAQGQARLLGWAVIENASGHDWDAVRLTLATGAVRAIAPDLYARRDGWREPAASPDFARTLAATEAMAADSAPRFAAPAPAPVAAADSDSVTRFTLDAPVTLAAGQMLSLPFLAESLPDARLRLHRGGTGATHPLIALEIENPLPLRLPAGVLTLYEDGIGHAGDARIPELAPGANAVVDFARDTAITIRETAARTELVREMRLVRGVLEVAEDLERETRYRISGAPGADRVLTLDHPRQDDWALDDPEGVTARPDAWRWQVELPAGAEVTHVVRERQPRLRRLAIADMDLPTLAEWQAQSPDDALRDRLAALADLRRDIIAAETALARTEAEIAELEREQTRLVDLIVRLDDDSDATRSRRARVDALDDEIAQATTERRELASRIDALRSQIADRLAE